MADIKWVQTTAKEGELSLDETVYAQSKKNGWSEAIISRITDSGYECKFTADSSTKSIQYGKGKVLEVYHEVISGEKGKRELLRVTPDNDADLVKEYANVFVYDADKKEYLRIKSIGDVADGDSQFTCIVAGRGRRSLVVDWVFIDVNDATVEKEEEEKEEEGTTPTQKKKGATHRQWLEEEEEEIRLKHQEFGGDWQKIYDNSSILQERYANSGVKNPIECIKKRYNSHIKNGEKKSGGGSKKKKNDDDDAAFSPLSEGGDEPLNVDDEEDDAASEYVDHSSRTAKRTKRIHNQKPPLTRRDNNNSTTPSEEQRPSIISNSTIGMPQNSNGIRSMGSSLVSRLSSGNRTTIMGSGGTSNGNQSSNSQELHIRNDSRLSSINQSSNNQEPSATQLITTLVSEMRKGFSGNSNSTEPKITPPDNPENFKYLPIPVGTESSDGRKIDKESYYNFETNQIETERPSFKEIQKKLPVAAVQQQSTAVPQIMPQQQTAVGGMVMAAPQYLMPQQQMMSQQPQQYALPMMQQPIQTQYGMQMMPQQPMAAVQPQYGMQQPMMMMPQQPMMQQPMMQPMMMPLQQQQQAPNRRDDGWCCIQ